MNFAIHRMQRWFRESLLLQALGLAVAYMATAQFAASFAIMPSGIVVLWLPNAIVLAVLLLQPRRHWWLFCGAAILAEMLVDSWGTSFNAWQALGFGLVNVFEVLLSAQLLRHFCGAAFAFANLREVLIFAAIAMGLAPGLAALGGAWIYELSPGNTTPYWVNWRIWWTGDGMGTIALTPLLLGWMRSVPVEFAATQTRRKQALALTTAATILGALLFYPQANQLSFLAFSPVLLLPLTLWAAMQFGVQGVSLLGCFVSVLATWASAQGHGLFSSLSADTMTVVLQQFLATLLLTGLAFAAILNDLRLRYLSQKLFREAVEHMQEGLVITDPHLGDNPIIYANPKFEELTGYRADEILGQNCRFLHGTDSGQPELASLRKAIAESTSLQCTLQNFRKDGSPYWNLLTVSPIMNAQGALTHFIGIQRDVTQAKKTEDQLLQSNAQLLALNQVLEERVAQRTAELQSLATTDSLTGIHNRRYWLQRAEIEVAQAQRQQSALSMVMFDIDHFKHINDAFGHPTGDRVLVRLCQVVQAELRMGDTFARIGGEEFMLLLPQSDLAHATQVAQRVRACLEALEISAIGGTPVRFTASFGVVCFSAQCNAVDALMTGADSALYRAKHAGRNCVMSNTTA